MFGYKKNKKPFKLHINKKNAVEEYMEYMSQPPEVLENLRKCKIFMAIFIPVGIILSIVAGFLFNFKNFTAAAIALCFYFIIGLTFFFASKNRLENWKLRLVPLICLFTGWIMGTFCIQKIILMIINVVG